MKQKHLFPMIRDKIPLIWKNYTSLGSLSQLICEPELGSDSGIIGSLVIASN